MIRGSREPTWTRKAARQFSMSFLPGGLMGDTRVNEEVPFTVDRVAGMERNSKEYRAESAKNEVG